jgi:hypothetical protein
MSHHKPLPPLTPAQRLDYARKLRLFAEKMRLERDLKSAELNDWMADNYSHTQEELGQ